MNPMFGRRRARRTYWAVPSAVVVLAVAGCGSSGESSSTNGGSSPTTAKAAPAAKPVETKGTCKNGTSAVEKLPAEQRAWYDNVAGSVQTCASPYATWLKPKGSPPWTIGYAGTYSGNTWRQESLKRIQALAKTYKEAGLVDKLIVTDSGGDSARMIQQLDQMVDQGVDAILTTSPPVSAINGELAKIKAREIPFVSIDGDINSPNYLGTGGNMRQAGVDTAQWLAAKLGGKGTIIAVNGIPGIAASDQNWEGAQTVFKNYPNIKILGPIYGQYTESIAKKEILKLLSTHPEKIDGVWVQGSMEMAAVDALQQTGRPKVPVTFGGAMNTGVHWRENQDFWDKGFIYFPTLGDTDVAWNVMMRTLEGQGPKVVSMVRPPVSIGFDDLKSLVPADATPDSTAWMEPPAGTWWTDEQIDAFFEKPSDPLKFSAE